MIQFSPIFEPFINIDPIPISEFFEILHPCSIQECPIVQSLPISKGYPLSVCNIEFSWMLHLLLIVIFSLSPLITAPNQIDTPE